MSRQLSTQSVKNSSSSCCWRNYHYWGWQDLLPIAPEVADANRIFKPPALEPSELYSVSPNLCFDTGYRFVRNTNPSEMLIFVDGCALRNGSSSAQAGWGVVYGPLQKSRPIFGRLELDGNPQTNNRAELRAALASLSFQFWAKEGFSRVVIACDSEYVVKGISEWILKWRMNGWMNNAGYAVANQDLWKRLSAKLRELEKKGMLVQFWRIPREWNEADKYAKAGAVEDVDELGERAQEYAVSAFLGLQIVA